MRIEVARPDSPRQQRRPLGLHVRRLSTLAWLAIGLLACAGTLTIQTMVLPAFQAWAESRGHGVLRQDRRILTKLHRIPGGSFHSVEIPRLIIDIKFKHMQKIFQARKEALEHGFITQGEDDFVPASIRYGDRAVRAKLRLKGDLPDHLQGDKWSFRIQIKDGDQVFGLRRFSIQNPAVRGYQGEAIFFEALRQEGLIGLRYFFVNVTVNGKDIGLMAVEDQFTKELLEANGRREGPILRFDESLFWQAFNNDPVWFDNPYDDYRNTRVDSFETSKIEQSEVLSREYETAAGLMRAFVNGQMAPSQVFDARQMGAYLAVSRFWGSWHCRLWRNIRFYFNPITAKLEPIGFDASLHGRIQTGRMMPAEPLVKALFRDERIREAYRATLRDLIERTRNGSYTRHFEESEKQHLAFIQSEFFFVDSYPFQELPERARAIEEMMDEEYADSDLSEPGPYPAILHAFIVRESDTDVLELANAISEEVEVRSLQWVSSLKDSVPVAFDLPEELGLPLTLPVRTKNSPPVLIRIPCRPGGLATTDSLIVVATVKGQDQPLEVRAKVYPPALHEPPIPESSVEEQLARHPFLHAGPEPGSLVVSAGEWHVRGSLIVPEGSRLAAGPGTTLRFDAAEAIISRGALDIRGSGASGVVLEGLPSASGSGSWQGIVVLGAHDVTRLSHVDIRNTSGVVRPGWELTGGVTFFESDVEIEHSRFLGHQGEDALNIVRSNFDLSDVSIAETASDAFDADFSEGTMSDLHFEGIGRAGGGDAIDLSGSTVTLSGADLIDIQDKALSVGEKSLLKASRVRIERVGTGAASKDGSTLEISNSTIRQARFAGLAAYIKKPEYGPPRIDARGIQFFDVVATARAQTGSVISIEGTLVETEDIDVEQLYDTIMQRVSGQ